MSYKFGKRYVAAESGVTESKGGRPSALFGGIDTGRITRSVPYRIGLWPCVSKQEPEIAMGVWCIFSHLLENPGSVLVYRLMSILEDPVDSYEWDITKSQFSPDDWLLEGLDDNIGIWGNLEVSDDGYHLYVEVESDVSEDSEQTFALKLTADNLSSLISDLPSLVKSVFTSISFNSNIPNSYEPLDNKTPHLEDLLVSIFEWHRNLYLSLWGIEWDDEQLIEEFTLLMESALRVSNDFSEWVFSSITGHALKPGYGYVAESVMDHLDMVFDTFGHSVHPVRMIVPRVFNMGEVLKSFRLVERQISNMPDNVELWAQLVNLQMLAGYVLEAISNAQKALERELTSANLYKYYGLVMLKAYEQSYDVSKFILIDENEAQSEYAILFEASEAFYESYSLLEDVQVLFQETLTRIQTNDEETIWSCFEDLVEKDTTGDLVAESINALMNLDDLTPGIQILEGASAKHAERTDITVNLASAYMAEGLFKEASNVLRSLNVETIDSDYRSYVRRLMVWAKYPDFEQRFAEVSALIDAGSYPTENEIEMLEIIVEEAPEFADAYSVLAKAYLNAERNDDALEILLDANESCPEDTNILVLLAQVLWQSGQQELSFKYLKNGISENPNDVSLLATAARFLFDSGNKDEARSYLLHAESIDPRNAVLQGVRSYIAKQVD